MRRLRILIYAFILIAATVSIYAHTARYGFIGWDDDKDILNKPRIQQLNISSVVHLFDPLGIFQGQYYYEYFPVTDLTYMTEWHFYGKDSPQGFHLDNVLLQTINVLLVFAVTLILLNAVRPEDYDTLSLRGASHRRHDEAISIPSRSNHAITAFFTALFFAVHPLMVENVAWLSGRKDLLAMMFYLLWFIFYMRSDKKNTRSNFINCFIAYICFLSAILSKFQAVTIPGVLAAYEYFINRRGIRDISKRLVPYVLLLAVYVPYTMWYYHKGATAFVDNKGFLWTILFIPEAIFIYIRKFLLPFNLTPVYAVPSFPDTGLFIISLVFFIALLLWIIKLFKKKEFLILFGLAWFSANFIPVSNIISLPTKLADRYMYEAALGIFLIAGTWMADFYNHVNAKRTTALVYASVFLLLAFLSYRQSLRWENSYSLWSYTADLQPQSAVARNNLGVYYDAHDQPELAKQAYELALKYDNSLVPALWNLGGKYLKQGNYEKAFPLIKRMSEIKAPEQYIACRALGAIYLKFYNKPVLAKKYFKLSYRLNPNQPDVKTLKMIIEGLQNAR